MHGHHLTRYCCELLKVHLHVRTVLCCCRPRDCASPVGCGAEAEQSRFYKHSVCWIYQQRLLLKLPAAGDKVPHQQLATIKVLFSAEPADVPAQAAAAAVLSLCCRCAYACLALLHANCTHKPRLWPAYPYQSGLDATDCVLLTFPCHTFHTSQQPTSTFHSLGRSHA
jgi:hypothetical protein